MLPHRQLADDELDALVNHACAEVILRTTRRVGDDSLAAEIVDRRLATHIAIASVLADIRTEPDRSTLLEPLRSALSRESRWLLSTMLGHVAAGSDLLCEVDDVASPDSIDCLMVAAGHDIDVARNVLSEAVTTILSRVGSATVSGRSTALGVFIQDQAAVAD